MTIRAQIRPPVESAEPEGIGQRAAGAARWRLTSAGLQAAVQFVVGLVLARLLAPADFGLAAMAAVVVSLAALILDLGLGSAVVQRRPLTDRHIRVAATLGLVLGATLAGLLLLAAPVAGRVMHAPGLPNVLRAEAVLFLLAGIGVTPRALLQRKLAFRQLAIVEFSGYAIGNALVAVILALHGFGVWSLVVGAILQSSIANLVLVGLVRPPSRPLFDRVVASELLRFGTLGSLNGAVGQVAFHGDNLVVGRFLGSEMLGLYGRAFSLMMLPLGYVGNMLFTVLFSTLSQLRDDRARFAHVYLQSIALASLATGPLMAGMAVAAPEMVRVLYGPQWIGAVLPLQIFCVVGIFRVLSLPAGAVTHAMGRIDAELRRQVVHAAGVLAGAAIGSRWGIGGAAVGVAAAILYKYVAMASLTIKISGITVGEFVGAQVPGIVLSLFVALAAAASRAACVAAGLDGPRTLGLTIAACAAAAVLGVRFLPGTIRPSRLFEFLSEAARPLPAPVRVSIGWALRIDG